MSLLECWPSCDSVSVPEIHLSLLDSLSILSQDTPVAGGCQMVWQLLGQAEKWIIIYTSWNLILKALMVLGLVIDCCPAPALCDGTHMWSKYLFPLIDSTIQQQVAVYVCHATAVPYTLSKECSHTCRAEESLRTSPLRWHYFIPHHIRKSYIPPLGVGWGWELHKRNIRTDGELGRGW